MLTSPGRGMEPPPTTRIRDRVMRRAEWSSSSQTAFRWKQPRDRMDAGRFEAFFKAHRRQDGRNPFGQHCFAGPERSDEKHVVDATRQDYLTGSTRQRRSAGMATNALLKKIGKRFEKLKGVFI